MLKYKIKIALGLLVVDELDDVFMLDDRQDADFELYPF